MTCRCCGRHVDKDGNLCGYCGLLQVNTGGSIEEEKTAQEFATDYREFVICNITDISVEVPLSGVKRQRICDANDCFHRIVWGRELPPCTRDDQRNREIVVRMNVFGNKKELTLDNAMIDENQPWKIGIGIDRSLRMYCYFGDEQFHICTGPYDLKI